MTLNAPTMIPVAGSAAIRPAGTDDSIMIGEKAAAVLDVAGYGQLWVKNTTPNQLWFTDDAGTDTIVSSPADLTLDVSTGQPRLTRPMASGSDAIIFSVAGADAAAITRTSGIAIASNWYLVFSSTSAATGTPDAGIYRTAAGTLKVSNGFTGFGTLTAGKVQVTAIDATTVGFSVELAATPTANAIEVNSNGGSGGDVFKVEADGDVACSGIASNGNLGFHGTTPIAQQTGVAVSAAAIHAALVNLGLITA